MPLPPENFRVLEKAMSLPPGNFHDTFTYVPLCLSDYETYDFFMTLCPIRCFFKLPFTHDFTKSKANCKILYLKIYGGGSHFEFT